MGSRPSSFVWTRPGPLRLYSTQELLTMPAPTWLIEPVIPAGGLAVLYGPPGVGKSFVAIDMALSVSAGGTWQGRPVVQGDVLYISAEGGTGIGKRAKAWLLTRGVEARQAPVSWLTQAIPVTADSAEMEILTNRINHELSADPTFIIIDTLARCFDGDENQQEDMGRFVAGADMLREAYNATVLIVHHTRLDGERERGNTALRGAADAMLSLQTRGKGLMLDCNKQKDAEEFETIPLRLKVVPSAESCVLAATRTVKKTQKTSDILAILERCGELSWEDWFSEAAQFGVSRGSFQSHFAELRQNGEITKENNLWRQATPE